jgi:calcium/calmodulin-dependent protein kinase I
MQTSFLQQKKNTKNSLFHTMQLLAFALLLPALSTLLDAVPVLEKRSMESLPDDDRAPKNQMYKDWKPVGMLGRGAQGYVYLAERAKTPKQAALKFLYSPSKPADKPAPNGLNSNSEMEVKALRALTTSQHVLKLYDDFQADNWHVIAMEYGDKGSIDSVYSWQKGAPEADAKRYSRQLIHGLRDIHAAGFAHRDIKTDNIVLVQGPTTVEAKYADFGLAARLDDTKAKLQRVGTAKYCAPEIFNSEADQPVDLAAVDIYALGQVLYRVITGYIPNPLNNNYRNGMDPKYLEHLPAHVRPLVEGMIKLNPKERWTMAQMLAFAWLKE